MQDGRDRTAAATVQMYIVMTRAHWLAHRSQGSSRGLRSCPGAHNPAKWLCGKAAARAVSGMTVSISMGRGGVSGDSDR